MESNKNQKQNELAICRRRMRLSQKRVATLLGHSSTAMLSRYENGRSFPPLLTALRLEIIYRIPLAYLYYPVYAPLRNELRALESAQPASPQPTLF